MDEALQTEQGQALRKAPEAGLPDLERAAVSGDNIGGVFRTHPADQNHCLRLFGQAAGRDGPAGKLVELNKHIFRSA